MLTKTLQTSRHRALRKGASSDLADLARLAGPIALVGLVNLTMSVTDAVLMADLEPKALTAGMVVGDLYSIVNQFAAGALGAVAAPVAIAHAAGDAARVGRTIAEGLRLALLLAGLGAAMIAFAPRMLLSLGVELPLPEVASEYAAYMAATYAVMTIIALSRSIFPAFGASRVVVLVIATAVPLNLICDLVLMHGWFGIPAMGLAGAGAASLVVAVFMALTLLAYMATAPRLRDAGIARALRTPARGFLSLSLARAALFTGATALSETGVFLSSTIVVAFVAIEAMPAHIVVFRALAVTYVIGTGFAQAVTIGIARNLAAADGTAERQLRSAAILGMGILASLFLAAMMALPEAGRLAGFDTRPILALAPWAAVATCSLVPSVVAFGILKARMDVAIPSLISFAGYWVVGFGLMAVLAGGLRLGATGIWAALAAGTAASAVGLWIYLCRRDATRVTVRPIGVGATRPAPA
jgi:MATE family multidrug resistance protein